MCDCIQQAEKAALEFNPGFKNSSFLNKTFYPINKTFSEVELNIGKKKKIINIMHTYCPMCGEKYPE